MRKILLAILLLTLTAALAGCAIAETQDVWIYAVSAGKADAILIGVDGKAYLVDAGYGRSRGKILFAMERMGVDRLEAVFVTHTDDDHTEGLTWLAESDIEVGAWYASALYTGVKERKHPAVKAAETRNQEVVWLQAGDRLTLGSATLDVLAPSQLNEDKDNNNSLVMRLSTNQGSILLAGDMEFPEEEILLASGANLNCDVLKVGNHADDDTTSEALVRAAMPKVAVISTDSAEKPETPDPRILALLESVGARTFVTQECTGGILVRLSGGVPSVERIDLPAQPCNVSIVSLAVDADRITLENQGIQSADLNGWYLYSDRGGELYVFPDGASLAPGASLTVGTSSTRASTDLFWDDKKVIHRSKADRMTLYDPNGLPVSSMDNGL